jgi:hypothetical protein
MERRRPGRFREDFKNHDRILVEEVHDAPEMATIPHAQLVAARSYRRQWSRMRHADAFSDLQLPQQSTGVDAAGRGRTVVS